MSITNILMAAVANKSVGAGFSAEAQQYFTRLDTAGDTTYTPYKTAIATYIDGLVSNSLWDKLDSSCLFVGVGLAGCVVPLKSTMPAVTNNNFVSGDQSVTAGLLGDGVVKHIKTGLTAASISQNDHAQTVYLGGTRELLSGRYISVAITGVTVTVLGAGTGFRARVNSSTLDTLGNSTSTTGLLGISRDNSADYDWIDDAQSGTQVMASAVLDALTEDLIVFGQGGGIPSTGARLSTYTSGSNLNLATLKTLQDQLIADIAAV